MTLCCDIVILEGFYSQYEAKKAKLTTQVQQFHQRLAGD